MRISEHHACDEYLIPPSRLSDIETKGVVPSVFRFYSLAVIYRRPMRALFQLYGIDLDAIGSEWTSARPPNTHLVLVDKERPGYHVPVKLDPGFDLRETSNLGRMVQQWGVVPLSVLNHLASQSYTYAYIGTEDYTMYPILQPGSFAQVDESKRRVVERRQWRSEYERPIYFVETRDGFTCCWCSFRANSLVLQPHPLSSSPVRMLRHPQDAEIIGQVVGVAMRIGDFALSDLPGSKESATEKPNAAPSSSSSLKAVNVPVLSTVSTRKKTS